MSLRVTKLISKWFLFTFVLTLISSFFISIQANAITAGSSTDNTYLKVTIETSGSTAGYKVEAKRTRTKSGLQSNYTLEKASAKVFEGFLNNSGISGGSGYPVSGSCVKVDNMQDVIKYNRFDINVRDSSGKIVGQDNIELDCNKNKYEIKITASDTAFTTGVRGKITGKLLDGKIVGFQNKITFKKGDKTYTASPDDTGSYQRLAMEPGTYQVSGEYLHYINGPPADSADDIATFVLDGEVKVEAGKVTEFNKVISPKNPGESDDKKEPTTDIEDSCYQNTTGLGWIVCPVLTLLMTTVNKTKDVVTSILTVKPLSFNTDDGLYKAWNNFHNFANALLILVFLLIIFGTTASIGIDNYTVKKALPRLIAAAILIQFSYLICSLAIDLSNILGAGIAGIIGSTDVRAGFSGWTGAFTIAAGAAGITALIVGIGSGALLFVFVGVILSIMGALLTLVFRQILILVLVVLSPIAFVAWVLPNTESVFKLWSKNFIKVLAMFPLIGIIFGISELFGKIAISGDSPWQQLIGIIALAAPLFAIPWTFKMSGQAMAFGGGLISGKLSGAGKSIRGSQVAKDFKQTQRQNRAVQALNSESRLGRGYGKLGALGFGGIPFPGTGKAKQKALAKLASSQRSDFASVMAGISEGATLEKLAGSGNVEEGAAAIAELAQRREYEGLDRVRQEAERNPGGNVASAYDKASSIYGDKFDALPDLRTGKKDNFGKTSAGNMSDEQIARSHKNSFNNFVNDITPSQANRILANQNLSQYLTQERRDALTTRVNNRTWHPPVIPAAGGAAPPSPAGGGTSPGGGGPSPGPIGGAGPTGGSGGTTPGGGGTGTTGSGGTPTAGP